MTRSRVEPLAASLLLLVGSCTILGLDVNSSEADELRAARLRWNRAHPPAYAYTLERLCFCGEEARGPVRIVVRGDSVESRTYTRTSRPVPLPWTDLFGSVDELFDAIERAVADADSVAGHYHAKLGYPVDVYVDHIANAIDDEVRYRVTELTALPAVVSLRGAAAQGPRAPRP